MPHQISAAASTGRPSDLFSGTKNPLATSHSPITTRPKIANATMATAGYTAIGMTRRSAAFREFPRRQPTHTAPASAQAVTGHASYRVKHASANTQPVIAPALGVLVSRVSRTLVSAESIGFAL